MGFEVFFVLDTFRLRGCVVRIRGVDLMNVIVWNLLVDEDFCDALLKFFYRADSYSAV